MRTPINHRGTDAVVAAALGIAPVVESAVGSPEDVVPSVLATPDGDEPPVGVAPGAADETADPDDGAAADEPPAGGAALAGLPFGALKVGDADGTTFVPRLVVATESAVPEWQSTVPESTALHVPPVMKMTVAG